MFDSFDIQKKKKKLRKNKIRVSYLSEYRGTGGAATRTQMTEQRTENVNCRDVLSGRVSIFDRGGRADEGSNMARWHWCAGRTWKGRTRTVLASSGRPTSRRSPVGGARRGFGAPAPPTLPAAGAGLPLPPDSRPAPKKPPAAAVLPVRYSRAR